MAYRVIQWCSGSVGRQALRALLRSRDFALVGVYAHGADKRGRDAAELAGLDERAGIAASGDAEALLALRPDCVVYTAVGETRVHETVAELARILRSGANVVSSSLMNLIYPPAVGSRLIDPLREACEAGRATLFTNGIDPGFSGDAMPLAALQLCERVDSVRVQEIFDYGTHPDPHWATPFGFGQPPEAPAPILTKGVPTLFWGGMVRLLADVVGGRLDELRETTERWVAPESFDTPMIHVAAGTVAAVRFEIAGVVAGRPALFAEHVTRMRPQAAPDWPQPPPGARGVHRVAIEGVPSLTLDLTLRGDRSGNTNAAGVLATAMRIVNAIPAVCAAPPGLVCARDLPLGGGRHWLAS